MIYIVRISPQLIVEGLTTGYEIKDHITITQGLPPNCEFLSCQVGLMGDLKLSFKDDIEVPEGTAPIDLSISVYHEQEVA